MNFRSAVVRRSESWTEELLLDCSKSCATALRRWTTRAVEAQLWQVRSRASGDIESAAIELYARFETRAAVSSSSILKSGTRCTRFIRNHREPIGRPGPVKQASRSRPRTRPACLPCRDAIGVRCPAGNLRASRIPVFGAEQDPCRVTTAALRIESVWNRYLSRTQMLRNITKLCTSWSCNPIGPLVGRFGSPACSEASASLT